MSKLLRRRFLLRLLQLPLLYFLPARAFADRILGKKHIPPTRIAFGSCAEQDDPQPIWTTIANAQPSLFAFIGDNIYADTEDMNVMQAKYRQLARKPEFARFRKQVPIIYTWDDHDMGANDAGREYPKKAESKNLMLRFFGEPPSSPRWRRDGVYTSYVFGAHPTKLQIILMDLRWFRSPLTGDSGEYTPNPDVNATMLGAEQWAWLEEQLKVPADIRILASSSQFVSAEHGWEKWANFPFEKARLIKMIDDLRINNLLVISGDMHFGELSMETTPGGFKLYDLTSSGLNKFEPAKDIPNSARLGIYDSGPNFGMVTIDWETLNVTLEVRSDKGLPVIKKDVQFPKPLLS